MWHVRHRNFYLLSCCSRYQLLVPIILAIARMWIQSITGFYCLEVSTFVICYQTITSSALVLCIRRIQQQSYRCMGACDIGQHKFNDPIPRWRFVTVCYRHAPVDVFTLYVFLQTLYPFSRYTAKSGPSNYKVGFHVYIAQLPRYKNELCKRRHGL